MPSILDRITIQTPCTVAWDAMTPVVGAVNQTGDDKVRHCGECRLNVFNLSAMTRAEAETLLESSFATGQRVCTQFIRRSDGTILTADCVTARNRIRSRTRRVRVAAAALMAMILPAFATGCDGGGGSAAPVRPDPVVNSGGDPGAGPGAGPSAHPSGITAPAPQHDPEEHPLRGDTTDPVPAPTPPPTPTKGEVFLGKIVVAPRPPAGPATPKDSPAK